MVQSHNNLVDSYDRVATDLRISVTDRCNFRCHYCMPEEGMQWLHRDALLSYEEIARLTRVFTELGVRQIRLTGGEPLLRKELHVLVKMLSEIEELEDIAVTTNGYFLKEQAGRLADAGLHRVNVSLDALSRATFHSVTRRDEFKRTWEGIEAAVEVGLVPVKLNVVLVRGFNESEIMGFVTLARTRGFIVRFIEFMPIGKDDGWTTDKVITTEEILEVIHREHSLIPLESMDEHSPASRYRFADGVGEIGFISSVSHPFCSTCDRVRLTSDGKFRTCLFSRNELDLRGMIRSGVDDTSISVAIIDAVRQKERGHLINQPEFIRPGRTMSQIGG